MFFQATRQDRAMPSPQARVAAFAPTLAFLMACVVILGTAALRSASDIPASPPNDDIWQHAAALLALMENLADPANPFVATGETSRHFHPLWVAFAAVGRALDLSVWTLLAGASVLSMALLGLGIFLFARTYFASSAWAPLVLLLCMSMVWLVQPHHTGFHAFHTLLYGAAYPATMMIGAGLILWALTIRALDAARPRRAALWPLLLGGLMVTTHQLGAVIALIGAGAFVLVWPGARIMRRGLVGAGLLAGVALSFAWPYHSPVGLMLRPGNSSWEGGFDVHDPFVLVVLLTPTALGIFGLARPRARPLVLALLAYLAVYLYGLDGPQVAGRFLMPVILVLHVGLADLLLGLVAWRAVRVPRTVALLAVSGVVVAWLGYTLPRFEARNLLPVLPGEQTHHDAARALTADIPDDEEVAAREVLAWPIVGTGQRVLSVPWPEPGIHDLAARQAVTRALFDPALSQADRVALARAHGVRTLLSNAEPPGDVVTRTLADQAISVRRLGPYVRVDLYE